MNDHDRITGALAWIRSQGIAVTFNLAGSTGVIEDSRNEYVKVAAGRGTDRWVGAHVGAVEHDGAFWDHAGVLHYRYDGSAVQTVWFAFNMLYPDLPAQLQAAFTGQGLDAVWDGDLGSCVELRLGA